MAFYFIVLGMFLIYIKLLTKGVKKLDILSYLNKKF